VGRFLTPQPLPSRLLYVEPLRRRMRVLFADEWIADSEHVLLLHEPARYPVAYFPLTDVRPDVLVDEHRSTRHRDLGDTAWYTVTAGDQQAGHARLALCRPARPRKRAARPGRVRLAGYGRLLRRR
jgi:uncharacterized protein (DUF427 family)